MQRVALTGGIATGKTYVLGRLSAAGIPTVDADELAHALIQPYTPSWVAITKYFGRKILDETDNINRKKLGALVFTNTDARRTLEGIIHPEVYQNIWHWFESLATDSDALFAVAAIPLLYETGHEAEFDQVLVTACEPKTQIQRIMKRDNATKTEASQRLSAQLPIEDKVARTEYIIQTDGTFQNTDQQVEALIKTLQHF
jgi:dephospho-CoA kinase